MVKVMKGCIKELERLIEHYSREDNEYCIGIVDGLEMALDIIKNKEFYGD